MSNPVGAPTKLTPDTTDAITRALRAGVPVRWACEAAEIHYTTHYNWVAQGEEWLDTPPHQVPEDQRPYLEYSNAIRRARAEGLARPAAELYALIMDRTVDASVRLRGLQFLLTHADRDNWHPVQHGQGASDEDVVVELAW